MQVRRLAALRAAAALTLATTSLHAQNITLESASSKGLPALEFIFSSSVPEALSRDGRFVTFFTGATNLSALDTNTKDDVYVRDRTTGATELVSCDAAGLAVGGSGSTISEDGRYVCFVSDSTAIDPAKLGGGIVVRDRVLGTTGPVPLSNFGQIPDQVSFTPRLSADGRWVVFASYATNLVAGDSNGLWDVFVHDRQGPQTRRVSVSSSGVEGNKSSWSGSATPDGSAIVFSSASDNLVSGDTNGFGDVFVHWPGTGVTELVSLSNTGALANQGAGGGPFGIRSSAISDDARWVAFASASTNLVAGDTNGVVDVFLRDRLLGTTICATAGVLGNPGTLGGGTDGIVLSGDGRFVGFVSSSPDLIAGDSNGQADVFLRDCIAGVTRRVNETLTGATGAPQFWVPACSADGRYVLIHGTCANFVASDPVGTRGHAFVRDMQLTGALMSTYCTPKTNSSGSTPFIGWNGAPLATGNDSFFLFASGVLPAKAGLFFWSRGSASIPFGGGTLCLAPPIVREAVQVSGAVGALDAGCYTHHFSHAEMSTHAVVAGDTLYGQFWSRDPGFTPPNNIGLTGAVQFTVLP
ncbi:MAG: PD40 domain-containing protein [Planctomycetes bacterium]|nr:PD40 domain-containing protein [Planctomycetota bacterium]